MNGIAPMLATQTASDAGPVPVAKDPVIWLVLGLSFVCGGLLTVIPATFPIFTRVFRSNVEQLGRIALLYYLSALLFCLAGAGLLGRMGRKRALVSNLALISGALVLIGSARGLWAVFPGVFCLGLGEFSMVVIISAIITEDFGRIRQSLFSLQWLAGSTGGVVFPAAIGWWFLHSERTGGTWRPAYFGAAGIIAAIIPVMIMVRIGDRPGTSMEDRPTTHGFADLRHLLRNPAMYSLGALNLLHGISNGGMVFFVGQLYQKKFGVDAAHAAYFLSAVTAGFCAGRSTLSWVTARWQVSELAVLGVCAAVETLGYAVAVACPGYRAGVLAFGVAGFFGSGDAPSLSSWAGLRFSAWAVTAFSLMGAVSFIGGGTGPYLVGFFGRQHGIEKTLWLMPLCSLLMALIAAEWFRREEKRSAPPFSTRVWS